MRESDVRVGAEYLTRGVKVERPGEPVTTRGRVRVDGRGKFRSWWTVTWLMRDGSERPGMRRELPSRSLLVEMKGSPDGE